ncbi:MAG: zinc-binding dehydrogenase [Sphaerochaeta sp.]|jgi:alcohol dehydrogenase
MKAIVVQRPNELAVVDVPMPILGPYDALVKSDIAFICNATDRKLVQGGFPGIGPESYPLLLGHENVGTVIDYGTKVTSFQEGDRVIGGLVLQTLGGKYHSGWGGFCEFTVVTDYQAMAKDIEEAGKTLTLSEDAQIMRKVPASISLEAAGLLCTWREVYAGMFTDFSFKPGQDLIIFGCGPVGLSFIKFARLMGMGTVIGVDFLPSKRKRALQAGADLVLEPDETSIQEIKRLFPNGIDAVVDAVGNNSIIEQAVSLVRMGGSICVYGVLGAEEIRFNKSLGPYNFNLLVHQWPTRSAEAQAQEPLIQWIEENRLVADEFVTGRYSIANFEEAYTASQQVESIKTLVDFSAWH